MGTLKPWLVRSVKESDRKVDVRLVLTRSDNKVEKDTVTLDEEKGQITYVNDGRDVAHVTRDSQELGQVRDLPEKRP